MKENNEVSTSAAPEAPADTNSEWLGYLDRAATSEDELARLEAPAREAIMGEWFREGDLGFIYGARGLGKTWFALSLARKCAEGGSLADWTVQRARRVLYVDGEMPLEGLRERNAALADAPAPGLTFIQHEAMFDRTGQVLTLSHPAIRKALLEKCRRDKIEILFLDNLSCLLASGNEAAAWEQVTPWLLELRRNRIAVVIVAQAGRNGMMRGTSRREDGAFWIIQLTERQHANEAEGASFVARFVKNRNATPGACPTLEWHFFKPRNEVKANVTWNKLSRSDQFRQCIEEGMTSATDIAREMNLSKGHVSRLAHMEMKAGWLKKKGRDYVKGNKSKFSCTDIFERWKGKRAATVKKRPSSEDGAARGELITAEIACRVSESIAVGLPVPLALAAEGNPRLNEAKWAAALKRDPELACALEAAKARFYGGVLLRLLDVEDDKDIKWLVWLVERLNPELFGRLKTAATKGEGNHTVLGIPEDVLARAREKAAQRRAD